MSSRFLRFVFLAFFLLAALIHFYFNRTTLNPYYGKIFYKLGMECQVDSSCSFGKQLSYFKKAIFYDPNLSDAYYQLAMIYGKNGQHKEEIESYEKVALLDHTNGQAYFNVGSHYFQNGELDYALRYFLQSNRYKAGSHDTFYYMARIYEKKQMYKDAVPYYGALVLVGYPLSAEICERLGRISKIPDYYGLVLDEILKIRANKEKEELWKQIDRYIRTDQVPEFMRNPGPPPR